VVRLHGPWFLTGRLGDPANELPEYRRRAHFECLGIQHAHFVTATSTEILQMVRKHYGLELARSRIIPNPIDAAPEAKTWFAENRSRDDFLFVGRFDVVKGGDLALRAFAELAAADPNVKLTFAGPDRGIRDASGRTLN